MGFVDGETIGNFGALNTNARLYTGGVGVQLIRVSKYIRSIEYGTRFCKGSK